MKPSRICAAAAALSVSLLAGCGGGGDSQYAGGGNNSGSGAGTTGSCPTGASDCSGAAETARLAAIKLTASGVQTITASTNDLLATPRQRGPEAQVAYGLTPFDKGLAEVRVARNGEGLVTALNLLLSGMGISFDGNTDRPRIVEAFALPRGRVELGAQGMAQLVALPPGTDTGFWNNNPASFTGTQANYANNIYIGRAAATGRCNGDAACIAAANNGLDLQRGDWRSGGVRPDEVGASRMHEDGATMGPDQTPILKGYRSLWSWNYAHAHLSGWVTQDTVEIVEWGGTDEHNTERRGIVAFGKPAAASALPNTGTVRYIGLSRGWYSPDGVTQAYPITADVEVTANFAAANRNAVIRVFNLRIEESQNPAQQLAAESTNTLALAAGQNYVLGTMTHGGASGNLGARFFGPVVNGGPQEIAGVFSVRGSSTNPIVGAIVGSAGFIAKQVAP